MRPSSSSSANPRSCLEGNKKTKKTLAPPIPLVHYDRSSINADAFDHFKRRLGDTRGYSVEIPLKWSDP